MSLNPDRPGPFELETVRGGFFGVKYHYIFKEISMT